MHSRRLIFRHALISISFVLLYLLLNRPEVIFFSRIGFVAWYPAIGVVMALLLGVSRWYALLACFADAFASRVIYAQPVTSFSNTVGAAGIGICYGAAAYVLRGSLKIDLGLRRRRDVVRYVLVSATASVVATIIGVTCLIADHSITSGEYKSSALGWFLGDAIGLVGIAPFLLVHVFPHVRNWLSTVPSQVHSTRAHSPGTTFTFGALAETCGQIVTILAVLWAMFGTKGGRYDHSYLCFIPIIWIAMRQGVRRVVTGLLALNFGIVVAMHLFPPTAVLFTKAALLMLILSAVGLIVGSEVSERHRLAIDLNEQTTYLDSLIQNSPLGIVVLDRQGSVELANSAFERLFQYNRHELTSIVLDRVTGEFVAGRPYARQTWATDLDAKGRPIRVQGAEPTEKGTLLYPNANGATVWFSPSYSPSTGLVYVAVREIGATYFKRDMEYKVGTFYAGGGENELPADDSFGAIRALDAVTGAQRWEFRLHSPPWAGVLSTAGGLVFSGSDEGNFYALNDQTGKALWDFQTGGAIASNPIAFTVDGHQRIAISADRVLYVFGL